jgi:hypothetical protein
MFRTPGKRTVTATASTTFNGHTITDSTSITVFADNVKPVVDITAPAAGATLWSKLPYAFAGNSGDLNGVSLASAQGALPCDLLAWTVSGPSFSSWTGCHPEVPFPSAGSYSVVLKGTDRFGLSGTTSRSVTVVNQQPQTAPTASILQPAVNSAFWNGSPVTLKGGAHDVDNDAMTYKWEVRKEGTTTWTLIDTKKDTQWVPNVSTDSQCSPVRLTLRFTATDNDGSRPPVEVQVFVFVC